MPQIPIYFQKQGQMSPLAGETNKKEEETNPPQPRLRIHLDDLTHEATRVFTSALDISSLLDKANKIVLKELYDVPTGTDHSKNNSATCTTSSSSAAAAALVATTTTTTRTSSWHTPTTTPLPTSTASPLPNAPSNTPADTASQSQQAPSTGPPPIRSITLILRPMQGVAYTTSMTLDEAHKEIHLSLTYLSQVSAQHAKSDAQPAAQSLLSTHRSTPASPQPTQTPRSHAPTPPDRVPSEIYGVVVHETVHVWQDYADGTAPVGLTEGIADWVRLRAGLAPPHWKREGGAQGRRWDDGYEVTGYFLAWLEEVRFGPGTVRRINAALRLGGAYDEARFWKGVAGVSVGVLWQEYSQWLGNQKDTGTDTGK